MVRPRVLLVDDHQAVVDGISRLLSDEFDIVGTARDGDGMINAAAKLHPDLIVTDVAMPGTDGLTASLEVLKNQPDLPIVILSMYHDSQLVRRAFASGARAYVYKLRAGEELITAIHCALHGTTFISPNCVPPAT